MNSPPNLERRKLQPCLGCRFILLLHHSFVSLIFCARLLSLRYSANILNDKLLVRYYIPEMLRLRLNIGKKLLSYFYYYSKRPKNRLYIVGKLLKMSHFPPIFVLLKLTCLVTLFDRKLQVFKNLLKWTIFGIFN